MSLLTGMSRRAATLAGAAALGLVLTSCSGGTTSAGSEATLVAYTGQSGDYQINFNPFSPSRIGGLGATYETLFFVNKAEVSDLVPLLGTQQSWNTDGTVLSVTLRDGVTWSDGQPFTAKDVAFTFSLLEEQRGHQQHRVRRHRDRGGRHPCHLHVQAPAFVKGPDLLGAVPIVPEHLWKTINPTQDVVEKPIGTGAYLIGEFKPQAFTYAANPKYWGGEPKVKKIRFVALSGNQAGADGIAAGTVDWFDRADPRHQEHQEELPEVRRVHPVAEPDGARHLLQRADGLQGPADRPRRPARPLRRPQPDAAQQTGVPGHRQRDLPRLHAAPPARTSSPPPPSRRRWRPWPPNREDRAELGTGRLGQGRRRHLRQGRPAADSDRRDRHRLDGLHHRDRHDGPQLKAAGIELQAAQPSWNEWTRRRDPATSSWSSTRSGRAPRPIRTTSTTTSSPPTPPRWVSPPETTTPATPTRRSTRRSTSWPRSRSTTRRPGSLVRHHPAGGRAGHAVHPDPDRWDDERSAPRSSAAGPRTRTCTPSPRCGHPSTPRRCSTLKPQSYRARVPPRRERCRALLPSQAGVLRGGPLGRPDPQLRHPAAHARQPGRHPAGQAPAAGRLGQPGDAQGVHAAPRGRRHGLPVEPVPGLPQEPRTRRPRCLGELLPGQGLRRDPRRRCPGPWCSSGSPPSSPPARGAPRRDGRVAPRHVARLVGPGHDAAGGHPVFLARADPRLPARPGYSAGSRSTAATTSRSRPAGTWRSSSRRCEYGDPARPDHRLWRRSAAGCSACAT